MLGIMYVIRSMLRIGLTRRRFEVPCPTTFKREAINDTLPAKVPKGAIGVLSTIDKCAANESSICGKIVILFIILYQSLDRGRKKAVHIILMKIRKESVLKFKTD